MALFSLPYPYRDKAPLLVALIVSSILSALIYFFRVFYSGHLTFGSMLWNLFLAWIPLWSALVLWYLEQRKQHAYWLYGLCFACWLLFFPNSPYLVTDLIHLAYRQNVPLWYDLMMMFSFAWNGLMLGLISLWIVQESIQTRFGRVISHLVVGFSLAACGFGIYLGRFLRWNSWDLFWDPHALSADIFERILNPLAYPQTVGVTLLFSSFLAVAYITLTLLTKVRWAQTDTNESISR